ncbi:MAG: ATP-sensitive inward rectifier potassium channel 10 [Alphaproteobacteria bacterium]|nr:ATP-sensitive inward rectifier potassium channel 10 [Alphaproteobacteria bacterium]MCB9691673.1 ATP-sensitive inward rectifier potassium channel 10 [Alphaproteobacteria bacterium]
MASPIRPTSDEFVIVGVPRTPLADAYHLYLRAPLSLGIGMIVSAYLALNLVFAVLYWLAGGIANATGSLLEAFFFSVQTMSTIGYGSMYPTTTLAHGLVTAEAVVGLVVTAVSTGLVFVKISQPRARIAFSEKVAIGYMNGVPTLQLRVGNERANFVYEAQLRVVLVRTEPTEEGVLFYRMLDLPLVRARTATLTRTWTAMHRITPDSPLWGSTPESLEAAETELQVTVVGTDDTTLQPVHAGIRYVARDFAFDARPSDVLSELPDGRIRVDLREFHRLTPTDPIVWED